MTTWKLRQVPAMDPTDAFCRILPDEIYRTLTPTYPSPLQLTDEERSYLESIEMGPLTSQEKIYFSDSEILDRYYDAYEETLNSPAYDQMRRRVNPYEDLGRNIFMNRAGVKLANLDAVFNFTNNQGYLHQQVPTPITFVDIAGAPGAFTQYLQWRRPGSSGVGISLACDIGWSEKLLDMRHFQIVYGPDGSGNLYHQARWFGDYVRSLYPDGVDLALADGGFAVEKKTDRSMAKSRLLLSEVLAGLMCVRAGGTFVMKFFSLFGRFSGDLIYLIAAAFEDFYLFKPVSSRPTSAERYVVARGRRDHIDPIIQTLTRSWERYQDELYVYHLVREVPPRFHSWLRRNNDDDFHRRLRYELMAIALIRGMSVQIEPRNLYRCLIIWDLPSEPERRNPHQSRTPPRC